MDPALTWTMTLALAMLFAASAAMKFADLGQFLAALENYRILPQALTAPASWTIPALEVAASVGLLLPVTRTGACVLMAALLAIFTAAIAINLGRGRREIDCGCFGAALRQKLGGWLVVRNMLLLVGVAVAAATVKMRPLMLLDGVTIVFGAGILTILYASMNYLLANAPWIREVERLHA